MDTIKYDKYNTKASDALICFIQSWSPSALYMAHQLDKLRHNKEIKLKILLIDYDNDIIHDTIQLNMTPVCIIRKNNKQVLIRRNGYTDNIYLMGSLKKDQLKQLITQIEQYDDKNQPFLELSF